MNTYAHVLPRLQRDATTKIEELIGRAKPQGEGEAGEDEAGEDDTDGAEEGESEGTDGVEDEDGDEGDGAEKKDDSGARARGRRGNAADRRGSTS